MLPKVANAALMEPRSNAQFYHGPRSSFSQTLHTSVIDVRQRTDVSHPMPHFGAMPSQAITRGPAALAKAPTGIPGLDTMLKGGVPRGRITLIQGASGAGKTVLALQSLVNGARHHDEPGIFVAFEEQSSMVLENAASFDWKIAKLAQKELFFMNAQPPVAALQSGSFDLGGMLAALETIVRKVSARRVVFDAIDVVLAMMNDPVAERRELYRLRDWIHSHSITTFLTSKLSDVGPASERTEFIQFMVDCGLTLEHRVEKGVSQRNVRVTKYRGTAFQENESPYVIGSTGFDVSAIHDRRTSLATASSERVSSGSDRLDTMLGGGYFRGAGILLTGAPGTSKTTLASAFAEAACRRREQTLYITFDSGVPELIRNMKSVGIRLDRQLGGGTGTGYLRMETAQSLIGSAETQLAVIQAQAVAHSARCLVIDPVSALTRGGNDDLAESVACRLIDWAKFNGLTLLCTSLLGDTATSVENSPLRISTLADTWLHLSYVIRGGERNRALTIVKSRGTAHSNQVRELVLSASGVTLADAYSAGGEVLMGTLRWEREQAEAETRHRLEKEDKVRLQLLVSEQAQLSAQMSALQSLLEAKGEQVAQLRDVQTQRVTDTALRKSSVKRRRSADAAPLKPKAMPR
jgi:circadian clock protein KaiC